MRDVVLHRNLRDGRREPDDLVELEKLAALPPAQRVGFVGVVLPLLDDRAPTWRIAALRALTGMRGHAVEVAIVACLDDDDPDVRRAAVVALRRSPHTIRHTHALLHARVDVRRAALENFAPLNSSVAFALRADPSCLHAVPLGLHPPSLAFLHAFVERGLLSFEEARRHVFESSIQPLLEALHYPPLRARATLWAWLFDLFAEGSDADRERLLQQLRVTARGRAPALDDSLAALWVELTRRPRDDVARALATLDASYFANESRPLSERRAMLANVVPREALAPTSRDRHALATALLTGPVVRFHEGPREGALDLRAAVAIASLHTDSIYGVLVDAFGFEALADGLSSDRLGAAKLYEQLGGAPRDRAWFLRELSLLRPEAAQDGRAVALIGASVTDPTLRTALDAELKLADHALVFARVAALAGDFTLKPKRATRLAERLVERLDVTELPTLLRVASEGTDPLGLFGDRLLGALGRRFDGAIVELLDTAPDGLQLAERVAEATTFPFLVERALAERWRDHPDDARRAFAAPRLPKPPPPPPATAGALAESTRDAIASAPSLANALRTLHAPTFGICEALARRAAEPSVSACAVLLASHDRHPHVVRELCRFEQAQESFRELVITECVARFLMRTDLPVLAHAMLHRWEKHAYATLDALVTGADASAWREGVPSPSATPALPSAIPSEMPSARPPEVDAFPRALAKYRGCRSVLARREVWTACARAFALLRWHDRERLATLATDALLDLLVDTLQSELGVHAARMFVAVFEAGVADTLVRARHAQVRALLPRLDNATRAVLSSFAKVDGLPPRASAARSFVDPDAELRAIRTSDDVDHLVSFVDTGLVPYAEEAVQRLFELGARGELALLAILDGQRKGALAVARYASLFAHVTREALLERLFVLRPPPRFYMALELDALDVALSAALAPLEAESWLEADDVERLRHRLGARRFALDATVSPHPEAYERAVRACLEELLRAFSIPSARGQLNARPAHMDTDPDTDSDPGSDTDPDTGSDAVTDTDTDTISAHEAHRALARFLEEGTERIAPLRVEVAHALARRGDMLGTPLLVADALAGHPAPSLSMRDVVLGALAIGEHEAQAASLFRRSMHGERDPELALALIQSRDAAVRAIAADVLTDPSGGTRRHKLRTLAEVFVWGVRRGRELTSRLVRVHLTSDRHDLGHTRLGSSTIHVGGWPIFDGEAHGRDIVEGLVIHELGHQAWHADTASLELWAKAGREGLQHLYNLVLDEHLERRLRARDARDGDRLKRLAAYAFQHSGREVGLVALIWALGPDAASVLCGRLLVAFDPLRVRVESGAILRAASDGGSSFARFVRALRMGLGDRHTDPRVREALALFDRGFKEQGTAALYAITLKLAEIFGGDASLLRFLGTPEECAGDDPLAGERREGISDDEVQREVERILAPPSKSSGGARGKPGGLQLNVGPDDGFTPIRDVVRLPPNPTAHRALALEVARPTRRLRAELEHLGLSRVPVGARLAGTRLDRPRLSGLVLRGDPHVMQARVLAPRADLFLGVAVDCSGSMVGASIELARRFAVLLAESSRGLRGVDLRVFGFTHTQLFDAGDADRSAAASLEASGGNNDAAALAHVAEVARRSGRRAKLLVMISDGLPTECSVGALRRLVKRLGREGMACAQIAVRPLEERCFDDYVEVRDLPTDEAVRRFGAIVARLVQRTIGAT